MFEKLKNLIRQEPVRVRLYGVAVLVLGYLLARHVISATDQDFILSLLGIVLGVETARSRVSPYHADEHAVEQDYGYDTPADEVGEGDEVEEDETL